MVASVRRVTDIMSEITAAGHEQTAGIEQIHQAVMQMDQVTQQNAALVEEAAAAAESLQDQARNLVQVVSVFKLGHGDGLKQRSQSALMPAKKPVPAQLPNKQINKQLASNEGKVALAGVGADWEQF